MKTAFIVNLALLFSLCTRAQTASYTFIREGGQVSYLNPNDSDVTEHTVADDMVLPAKVALGFSFFFNGVRYDSVGISENGFIWFGPAQASEMASVINPITTTLPASVKGIVCAFGIDLHPHVNASTSTTIRSKTQWWNGQPSDFIVEWRNTSRQAAIGDAAGEDTIGFQIQLFQFEEDRVQITYGYDIGLNPGINSQLSVGLKGSGNDFALRTNDSTYNWNKTVAATTLEQTCLFSAASNPGKAFFNYMSWLNKNTTGLPHAEKTIDLNLYPIPAGTLLYIDKTGFKKCSILNIDGSLAKEIGATTSKHLDVADLDPGLYLLQVYTDEGSVVKRFIKN